MGLFSPKDPYSSSIFDQSQDEQPEASYPHGYCPVCFNGGTGPQCHHHAAQIARILDPVETAARHRRLEQIGWKF